MGGGGSSSSSNTTNTTNTNGTSAIHGDNLGVVLSGINGNIGNISMTDHGSVKAAGDIAKSALANNAVAMKSASDLGKEALKSNESVSKKALDTGVESLKASLGFSAETIKQNSAINTKALESMRKNSEDSIAAVKNMAAQSGQNAQAALLMAEKTAGRNQTGNSADMTKVVMVVAAAFSVAAVAFAVTRGGS